MSRVRYEIAISTILPEFFMGVSNTAMLIHAEHLVWMFLAAYLDLQSVLWVVLVPTNNFRVTIRNNSSYEGVEKLKKPLLD